MLCMNDSCAFVFLVWAHNLICFFFFFVWATHMNSCVPCIWKNPFPVFQKMVWTVRSFTITYGIMIFTSLYNSACSCMKNGRMNNSVSGKNLARPLGLANPASSSYAPISERPGLHCLAHDWSSTVACGTQGMNYQLKYEFGPHHFLGGKGN